jgi:hypothetical protein
MSDADEVRRVAENCVRQRGARAVPWLIERAELAEAMRDWEGGKIWREIAAAAEQLLPVPPSLRASPLSHPRRRRGDN